MKESCGASTRKSVAGARKLSERHEFIEAREELNWSQERSRYSAQIRNK